MGALLGLFTKPTPTPPSKGLDSQANLPPGVDRLSPPTGHSNSVSGADRAIRRSCPTVQSQATACNHLI
jgi:hypothetical protein